MQLGSTIADEAIWIALVPLLYNCISADVQFKVGKPVSAPINVVTNMIVTEPHLDQKDAVDVRRKRDDRIGRVPLTHGAQAGLRPVRGRTLTLRRMTIHVVDVGEPPINFHRPTPLQVLSSFGRYVSRIPVHRRLLLALLHDSLPV